MKLRTIARLMLAFVSLVFLAVTTAEVVFGGWFRFATK